MPIYRRLPKRGFKNPFRKVYAPVNLDRLQAAVDGGRIDPGAAGRSAGPARRRPDLQAPGRGPPAGPRRADERAHDRGRQRLAQPAIAAVEKAGGKLTLSQPRAAPEAEAGGAPAAAPSAPRRPRAPASE